MAGWEGTGRDKTGTGWDGTGLRHFRGPLSCATLMCHGPLFSHPHPFYLLHLSPSPPCTPLFTYVWLGRLYALLARCIGFTTEVFRTSVEAKAVLVISRGFMVEAFHAYVGAND